MDEGILDIVLYVLVFIWVIWFAVMMDDRNRGGR